MFTARLSLFPTMSGLACQRNFAEVALRLVQISLRDVVAEVMLIFRGTSKLL